MGLNWKRSDFTDLPNGLWKESARRMVCVCVFVCVRVCMCARKGVILWGLFFGFMSIKPLCPISSVKEIYQKNNMVFFLDIWDSSFFLLRSRRSMSFPKLHQTTVWANLLPDRKTSAGLTWHKSGKEQNKTNCHILVIIAHSGSLSLSVESYKCAVHESNVLFPNSTHPRKKLSTATAVSCLLDPHAMWGQEYMRCYSKPGGYCSPFRKRMQCTFSFFWKKNLHFFTGFFFTFGVGCLVRGRSHWSKIARFCIRWCSFP